MAVVFTGRGLHTGRPARLTVHPRPAGSGLLFRRTDLPGHPTVPVEPDKVGDSTLHTRLSHHDVEVATVEHLLAACHVVGLWDAELHLDGQEVPILDGSAQPFVEGLAEVATAPSPAALIINKTLDLRQGPQRARVRPASTFSVTCAVDFDHPVIGRQQVSWNGERLSFERDFARARTFGFLRDVERMRRQGLALGGSLDNALVFDEQSPLIPLRMPLEPACHKLLDVVGDLALLGRPLVGAVEMERPSHALTTEVVRRLWQG